MTVPAMDSASLVLCLVPVCASPRSYTPRFITQHRWALHLWRSAFGGDNVRVFADLYMSEVAGLVLVDADPNDVEPKAMREGERRGIAGMVSRLRDCRNLIADTKPLPAQSSDPGQSPRTCAQQFFSRGFPEVAWSPELSARLLEIAETKVAMYDAAAAEMEQTPWDEAYLQQHRRSYGSRPIRVLTSGNHGVGHLEEKPRHAEAPQI